jgi:hypothetical protein
MIVNLLSFSQEQLQVLDRVANVVYSSGAYGLAFNQRSVFSLQPTASMNS